MKKIASLMLALTMLVSLVLPAFAEQAESLPRGQAVYQIIHMIGLNAFDKRADLSHFADAADATGDVAVALSAALGADAYLLHDGLLDISAPLTGADVKALLGVQPKLSGLDATAGAQPVGRAAFDALLVSIDESLTEILPQDDFFLWANRITLRNVQPDLDSEWTQYGQNRQQVTKNERAMLREFIEKGPDGYEHGTPAYRLSLMIQQLVDATARNEQGITPILPYFERIDACQSVQELWALTGALQAETGTSALFIAGNTKEDQTNALYASLSPLPLAPFIYLTDAEASLAEYKRLSMALYQAVGLRNVTEETMDQMLEISAALANSEPFDEAVENTSILVTTDKLDAVMGNLDLTGYMQAVGFRGISQLMIDNTAAYSAVSALLTDERLPGFKLLCKHQLLSQAGVYLNDEVSTAARRLQAYEMKLLVAPFGAHDTELPDMEPSPYDFDKEDELYLFIKTVDANGDFAAAYADRYTPEGADTMLREMLTQLMDALALRIEQADWMSEKTRRSALNKLSHMTLNLLTPTHWRHTAEGDSLCATMLGLYASSANEAVMQANDRAFFLSTWEMTSDTVNACYDPNNNSINIPCAEVAWPLYVVGDSVQTLGGLGSVVGHELIHGFDPFGSQYDAQGLTVNWWTAADHAAFTERVQAVKEYYAHFAYRQGHVQDPENFINEAVADLGGLSMVMQILDGDTEAQRAALTQFAMVWAEAATDEQLDELAEAYNHPLKHVRCNAAVSAMAAFYECFDVQPGDGMYIAPEARPTVW